MPTHRHIRSWQLAQWAIIDQGLSSSSNFAVGLIAARVASRSEYGAFALWFAAYLVLLGIARAIASDPLTVCWAARSRPEQDVAFSRAAGSAVAFALAIMPLVLCGAWICGGTLSRLLLVLSLSCPALLVQEVSRFAFIMEGRARAAAFNDFVWTALFVAVTGIAAWAGTLTILVVVLAWSVAGVASGLVACLQFRRVPDIAKAVRWIVEHRHLAGPFVVEFLFLSGSSQLVGVVVAGLGGLPAVGALRGAQLAMGPAGVAFMGVTAAVLPRAVVVSTTDPREVVRTSRETGVVLALAALGCGLAMELIPPHAGHLLLGDTWRTSHSLLMPVMVGTAATGFANALAMGVRAFGAARRSMSLNIAFGLVSFILGALGAAVEGALGAAIGLAVGSGAGIAFWDRTLRLEARAAAKGLDDASRVSHSPQFTAVAAAR
jgi:O-antigen/teichoic acid export membrane protein